MIRRFISSVLNKKLIIKSTRYFCQMQQNEGPRIIDYKVDQYGDYPFLKSIFQSGRKWTELAQLNDSLKDQQVLVRARIHNIRSKGNNCFIVLREGYSTVQAVAFKGDNMPKEMIKYMAGVSNESVVDISGRVKVPEKPIDSCSQQVQLEILKFFVVNRADSRLPLQIVDASRKVTSNEFDNQEDEQETKPVEVKEVPKTEEVKQVPKGQEVKQVQKGQQVKEGKEKKVKKQKKQKKEKETKEETKQQPIVKMKTRLDNRIIDLRTTAKHAIFRLQSAVCQVFREFLLNQDFVEIHTPKLIGGSSEGGANVFNLGYFGKKACLAQSPQLYKQMCVMGDFQKVFEIGPVFRAENSFTHRHMCEFVGLDIEMTIKEHYFQLLDFFGELFPFMFEQLAKRYDRQLKAINQQFEFEPFKCKYPVVKLTFEEGIQLLKDNGVQWPVNEDLSTDVQRKLGEFVRLKYDTDFYMLHRYPIEARPFYTTVCEDDPRFTCSYDFFMRGEEILSGAQRIHDPVVLKERAIAKGIEPETIKDYIDCFKYGAYPHGGGGIGLERVVMLFCGLKNIRNASLFPRDPKRITP